MAKKERRKHQRTSLEIPLDMADPTADGKIIRAKTVNLSAGGFYCQVPFYVPVLTRLRISMTVPVKDASGKEEDHAISCEGTVVRTVPEKPSEDVKTYEIGCFFTELEGYDRLVIEQYLAERILSGS
jgi:c-di-GMP-binding flagellar brake protein YcgR